MRVTKYLLTALTVILLASCSNCSEKKDNVSEQPYVSTAPTLNVDSAFAYVKAQCAFGPRVMNSAAHDSCGDYIVSQFKKYGGEVYEQFEAAAFPMEQIARKYKKWHIDLWEANKLLLLGAGVPESHIAIDGTCTYKNTDEYFSARRLGIDSGRIFTGVMILK